MESVAYLRDRPRVQGADGILSLIMSELLPHLGVDQARALSYRVGKRLAVENPAERVATLDQLQTAAGHFLAARDWGWITIQDRGRSIDIVQGCSPLRAWFGAAGLDWAAAFFEGFFSEWLRQLGSGEELELRQIGDAEGDEDVLCFRLMHHSRFAA